MVRLIALKATYYNGPVAAGTVFSVQDDKQANLLKLMGRAADAPDVAQRPTDSAADAEDAMPKARSSYRRRKPASETA